MYRHMIHAVYACSIALVLGGCGWGIDAPARGLVFTWVDGPINATSFAKSERRGESCAYSLLGLVAWGDASIHGAKSAGGVQEVSSVDHQSFSLIGVFGSYCTVVRGN
jgi:hypothetical protein